MQPDFDPDTTSYTIDVAPDVSTIHLKATASLTGSTVSIGGAPASQAKVVERVPLGAAGSATQIVIVVIATNGIELEYLVTVNRQG